MTYRELLYKAQRLINHNEITLGEYDEMTKPLDEEVRKVGKWEYKQLGFRAYGVVCTNCGYVIHQGYDFTSMEEFKDMVERKLQDPHITMDKFCCKCGAEMRGAENVSS